MLRHIPKTFTPGLMRLLMELGHGETLLITDANYPWRTMGGAGEPVFVPVADISALLAEILHFFPLDDAVAEPVLMMESARESGAFAACLQVLRSAAPGSDLACVDRFDFYKRTAGAAGTVVTADASKGANVLLTKGVVR